MIRRIDPVPDEPVLPSDLRRRLASLPDFAAPDKLLRPSPRVRRPSPPRRLRIAAVAGGLATLGWFIPNPLDRSGSPAVVDGSLDEALVAMRPARPSDDALRLEWELATLDARLQRAADAGQRTDPSLWHERESLQREILAVYREPGLIRL
jgi:hypothetical protein